MQPPSLPPIASPHGAGRVPAPEPFLDESAAYLVLDFPLVAACRYAVFEWLTPFIVALVFGVPALMAVALFPLLMRRWGLMALPLGYLGFWAFIIALAGPLTFIIRLCSRRRFALQISGEGVTKLYPQRDIKFKWGSIKWVIEWRGDLWLATAIDGCFVPRECFASPKEAHEFATLMRQLQQSRGAAWQRQWKGRVFGVHPYGQFTRIADE